MLGGILVQTWSWRATFWVMVILAAVSIVLFQFFKETFRRERSLAYQAAHDRALTRQSLSHRTNSSLDMEKGASANTAVYLTLADVNPVGPAWLVLKQKTNLSILFASGERHDFLPGVDCLPISLCPGTLFGFSYGICYTCARTFAAAPYNYNPLKVGAVLLSFGFGTSKCHGQCPTHPSLLGNVGGSILGGRWSDIMLTKLKAKNNGISQPEVWHLASGGPGA